MSTVGRDRQLKWLPLEHIVPNERNPRGRGDFDEESLKDLERSIQAHGILEPLIVQTSPRRRDRYQLIEGERRWTVAKRLGLKEVPATIIRRLPGDDQVVVMYNLHENRKGWEMASHLRAIQALMANSPEKSEEDLARELGLSLATFRDRLRVLRMGPRVVEEIAKGEVDYTSALRSAQAATAIAKKRPELTEQLGGEEKVQEALIRKARARGGISHELTSGKQDLTDTAHVPDDVIREYITRDDAGLREVSRAHAPVDQRRKVADLSKTVSRIEEDLKDFAGVDLTQAPNLVRLRAVLRGLIEVASALEGRITEAIIEAEVAPQTDNAPVRARRPRRRSEERVGSPPGIGHDGPSIAEETERIRQETLERAGIDPVHAPE